MPFCKPLALLLCIMLFSATLSAQPSTEALIQQKHYKRARAMAERILAANPKNTAAMVALASIEAEYKNNDAAITLASRAIGLQPGNAQAHAALAEGYGQKTDGNIGMFEKMRLGRLFKKEVDQALALDPKNADALWGMMIFSLEAPAMMGGNKSKAVGFADRIMAIDHQRGYLAQEELAQRAHNNEQFAGLLKRAVETDPHSYDALVRLAGFYASPKSNDLAQATSVASRAVQIDKGRAEAYDVLARIYAQQERWPDLDRLMQTAERNCPDDLAPYYQAARVLLDTGKDNARAERYFRKYLTQDAEPNNPKPAHAHWRLGLILEKEGERAQAIKELETALQLMPELKAATDDLKRIKS